MRFLGRHLFSLPNRPSTLVGRSVDASGAGYGCSLCGRRVSGPGCLAGAAAYEAMGIVGALICGDLGAVVSVKASLVDFVGGVGPRGG